MERLCLLFVLCTFVRFGSAVGVSLEVDNECVSLPDGPRLGPVVSALSTPQPSLRKYILCCIWRRIGKLRT